MKKIIIELSAIEAIILAAAILITASAVKKAPHSKGNENDFSQDISDMSIAAVSDAILNSPAAEYVFGERNDGIDIV